MIRIIDGYKEYKKKKVIFNNLNLELPSKGLVVVSGESGCGKSTLLNIISGLDTLTSGKLEHNYNNNDYACILLQQDYIFKNITIYDYLCFICNSYQKNKSIINDLLNKFKINDIKDKFGCDLSIGQIRRVELIRCIIMDLPVFICDEPTSSLDDDNKKIVVDILYELSKDHLVLVSTHDVELFNHSDTMEIAFDNGIICNVLPEHNEVSNIEYVKVKGYSKYIYINNKLNYFIMSLVFLMIQTVSLVLFCSSILKNKQIDIPELSSYIDNLFIIILFVFVICFSVCVYLIIMLYKRYLLDNKKMCGLLLVLREKNRILVRNLVLPLVIAYCITLVTSVIIGLLFISCINSYSKETYGFTLMIVNPLLVMYLIIVNLILGIIILGIGFSILNRNRIYYIRNEE
ncbi:MAG: ATP-binding cassette domain-containing protein [Anaeroplasmataceae bacterium]